MKSYLFIIALLCGYWQTSVVAQCPFIKENKVVGDYQQLKSNEQSLVIRGDYSYLLQFVNSNKGITGRMISEAGVALEQDDEVVFMDNQNTRRSYKFVEQGELDTKSGGKPRYLNSLQLDASAVQWMANSTITTIYIKNVATNEMRKFTFNENRVTEFKAVAACFFSALDKSKLKDVILTNVDVTRPKTAAGAPVAGGPATPRASTSGSGNLALPPGTKRNANGRLEDEDLQKLLQELAITKEKVKQQILEEREKGDKIKQGLAAEVQSSRENASTAKANYANEVIEARKKADSEIKKAIEDQAKIVGDAKRRGDTVMQKIVLDVTNAKQRAVEETSKAKTASAQEVADARKKASDEIIEVRKKLDVAKQQYADEVASARENSNTEMKKITEETAARIADAREKAKTEKDVSVKDVIVAKSKAAEEILATREKCANEIARIRENAVLEKEKLALGVAESRRKASE